MHLYIRFCKRLIIQPGRLFSDVLKEGREFSPLQYP